MKIELVRGFGWNNRMHGVGQNYCHGNIHGQLAESFD